MIRLIESVKCWPVTAFEGEGVKDRKLTRDMVPTIKLARAMGINYSWISAYYAGLNFGRIADVALGRKFRDVPAADHLPPDFPGR